MIDDLRSAEATRSLKVDVCIAGGGPAGISLALELARRGLEVCLLESGGRETEPDTQSLSQGDISGNWLALDEGRPRVLGGASAVWTGRLARLDDEDFKPRPWAGAPGWPIGLSDLEPYYVRAAEFAGCREPWRETREVLEDILPDQFWGWTGEVQPYVWRYGSSGFRRYTNWGQAHFGELSSSRNLRVLLHANLTGFERAPDGRISAVFARSLSGKNARVEAGAFVLACGGVENARLLLASAESVPGGVHRDNDNVGRYFMQHPRGGIASVAGDQRLGLALQDVFNVHTRRTPPQYEVGFALSQEIQAKEGLLNCSAVLRYEADPSSPWEVMKERMQRTVGVKPHAGARRKLLASDFALVARNIWRRGVQGRHALQTLSAIRVVIDLEQAPNPESRITLSSVRDALGMPKAQVCWRLSEQERHTARRFAGLMGDLFRDLKIGDVVPEPWLDGDGPIPDWALVDVAHHIGSTRMSRTAQDGVVDENLKIHGSPNVYVVGSSVFPSGGHANPTLTIVALALRLADHLAQRMKHTGELPVRESSPEPA